MQRALMWFNLYGRNAVRHKLKNRQKMHFLCFKAVFELMSDSLTTIQIEPYQCPLHQAILLTQRPIYEIFEKKILRIGGIENLSFFQSAIVDFFFPKKKIFLLHSHENQSKCLEQQGWFEILMIIMDSSKRVRLHNNLLHSVSFSLLKHARAITYFFKFHFRFFSKDLFSSSI